MSGEQCENMYIWVANNSHRPEGYIAILRKYRDCIPKNFKFQFCLHKRWIMIRNERFFSRSKFPIFDTYLSFDRPKWPKCI